MTYTKHIADRHYIEAEGPVFVVLWFAMTGKKLPLLKTRPTYRTKEAHD